MQLVIHRIHSSWLHVPNEKVHQVLWREPPPFPLSGSQPKQGGTSAGSLRFATRRKRRGGSCQWYTPPSKRFAGAPCRKALSCYCTNLIITRGSLGDMVNRWTIAKPQNGCKVVELFSRSWGSFTFAFNGSEQLWGRSTTHGIVGQIR